MIKIDFHIHSLETKSDAKFIFSIDKLKKYINEKHINAIAITNHNIFDKHNYNEISKKMDITVFPGIEIDLERGHMLVISDIDYLPLFTEKCNEITRIYNSDGNVTISKFLDVFNETSRLLLIPHYDKRPKMDKQILNRLENKIFCGEVSNANKFARLKKEDKKITPLLFSDFRPSESNELPNTQTFLDVDSVGFSVIKECLKDKTKVYLNDKRKSDLFPILNDGTLASTGLNVVLGKRSTGKTYTMDTLYESFGKDNIKYIKQFELVEKDKEEAQKEFDLNLSNGKSLFTEEYLSDFKIIVDSMHLVDLNDSINECDEYVESLRNFAIESDKLDSYARVPLFKEQEILLKNTSELTNLIASVEKLLDSNNYKEIIEEYASRQSLINLHIRLITEYNKITLENAKIENANSIIRTVKNALQIKSSNNVVSNFDCIKYAKQKLEIYSFEKLVNVLKEEKKLRNDPIGKFSIQVIRKPIRNAKTLQTIYRKQCGYKDALDKYSRPYEYFKQLTKLIQISKDDIYKGFVNIEYSILNADGYPVSGGQRAEYNLEQKLCDAEKYEMLLIDEPESSFDNLFLKSEINSRIKEISKKMPVFVTTHNNVVGGSIKPDYVLYTEMKILDDKPCFKVYGGITGEKMLISSDGSKIKNYELTMNCLEGGETAYNERGESYETIKDK